MTVVVYKRLNVSHIDEGCIYVSCRLRLNDIALLNKSSQSYEASLPIWDHKVSFHPTQVNTCYLIEAGVKALNLPTPKGWKAELT